MGNDKDRSDRMSLLRRKAEETLGNLEDGQSVGSSQLSPEEARRIVHQLRVHQIELEMQNEELRQANEELDRSKARYFELFDLAPVGYMTLDAKGEIVEINLTAARLLGKTRCDAVGTPLARYLLLADMDTYYLHSKKLLETKEPQSCEIRLPAKAGATETWVCCTASVAEAEGLQPAIRLVMNDITNLKDAQEGLHQKAREQKILLRETHHRIKNNISMISSMLSLQKGSTSNPDAIAAIQGAMSRVMTMRKLYDQLLVSGEDREMPAAGYFDSLTTTEAELYAGEAVIRLVKHFDDFTIRSNLMFHLGIIVNELLTNVYKYAFEGRKTGTVEVSVTRKSDRVLITVQDDGTGLPEGFTMDASTGYGLTLVKLLGAQLKGNLKVESREGTLCTFECDVQ